MSQVLHSSVTERATQIVRLSDHLENRSRKRIPQEDLVSSVFFFRSSFKAITDFEGSLKYEGSASFSVFRDLA